MDPHNKLLLTQYLSHDLVHFILDTYYAKLHTLTNGYILLNYFLFT